MYSDHDDHEVNDLQSRLMKLLPSQTQDIIATAAFLVLMPTAFLVQIFYVLPIWYPAFGEAWVIRVGIMLMLAFNTYVNWYKMVTVGPNGKTTELPNVVKPGFKYCHSCHTNAPPRAFHCPVCDQCWMRRDHHCSFGGVCIGHFNQRYFVGAILNLFILMVVLSSYMWAFLSLRLDGAFTLTRSWQIMLPHLALVARVISFHQFMCVVFAASTFSTLLFTTYLIAAQAFCLWNGQSRVEYLMEIHAYQLPFLENLRQSLGSRWPLIILSPFIPSPLPSDGLSFITREVGFHASAKDM